MSRTKLIPGQNDLQTVNPQLAAEWHPTKNDNLTPSMVRSNSSVRVWWLGKCGHEWQASVHGRAQGAGCPFCANRAVLKGFNDLESVAPDLVQQWHPTKNGGLTPDRVLARSTKPAFWQCENGHEWEIPVNKRVNGIGCPYCNNKQVLAGYNDLLTTHPDIAAQWHPEKNEFGPDTVTAGSQKKIWWQCEKSHEWLTTVGSRTNADHGCPYCSNKKLLKSFNDFATRFPEISMEWHPVKNQPLTPSDILIGTDKIWWECSVCGHEWQALPQNRVQGHGCPMCANRRKGRYPRSQK